jgi:hypothetical protein
LLSLTVVPQTTFLDTNNNRKRCDCARRKTHGDKSRNGGKIKKASLGDKGRRKRRHELLD